MSFDPIFIDAPPADLFGPNFQDLSCWGGDEEECELKRRVLLEALDDGVLNDEDFDRYRTCERKDPSGDRFLFLRRAYVHLREFSRSTPQGLRISPSGAEQFHARLRAHGRTDFRWQAALTNEDVLGDELRCREKGRCPTLRISSEKMLLVIHPTRHYDESEGARAGIEKEVAKARGQKTSTAILLERIGAFDNFYVDELDPTAFIASSDGEHPIRFAGKEVTIVGGRMWNCLLRSLRDFIFQRRPKRDLIVRIPKDAVYVTHRKSLQKIFDETDARSVERYLENFGKRLSELVAKRESGIIVEVVRDGMTLRAFEDPSLPWPFGKRSRITILFE